MSGKSTEPPFTIDLVGEAVDDPEGRIASMAKVLLSQPGTAYSVVVRAADKRADVIRITGEPDSDPVNS